MLFIYIDKMATAGSKRSRKPNFKQEELSVLVDEIEKNKTVILGKFSDTVSNERKKKLWISIATKCSAIGDNKRTADDMRKKWQDWSSQIKGRKCKEIRERNITGGGSADETSSFSATEERLLAILGQTPLVGVPGGTDSFDSNNNIDRSDLNISPMLVESDLHCIEEDSTLSDGDDQVNDNENSQAETEYDPNITTKQRENTQSNVGHAQENRPYPLLVRSEQERMIDEQLRKKICEQEKKKRTRQTPDIQIAKPKRMKLKCTDTNEEQNMQSNEIIEIEKERLNIEKDRLSVEKDRLTVEKERLEIERKKFDIALRFSNSLSTKGNIVYLETADTQNSSQQPESAATVLYNYSQYTTSL